jgi:hypothetical protein
LLILILGLGVTAHPTAEWMARQLTEACGWERKPSYIIRDRDRVYGAFSSGGFALWAFVIAQPRPNRHGRTAIGNG